MAKQGDILSNSGYPTNVQPKRKPYSGDNPSKRQASTVRRKAPSVKPLPGTK